jgi:hypothetical protein
MVGEMFDTAGASNDAPLASVLHRLCQFENTSMQSSSNQCDGRVLDASKIFFRATRSGGQRRFGTWVRWRLVHRCES